MTNLSINLPGTEYGPQTIKIPILASSNQLGNGLESRLFQLGVYLASFLEVTTKMEKGKRSPIIFMITDYQLNRLALKSILCAMCIIITDFLSNSVTIMLNLHTID